MVVIGVLNGVVEMCISCNSFEDVSMYFPELSLSEQVGEENVGWLFDGVTFTPPAG